MRNRRYIHMYKLLTKKGNRSALALFFIYFCFESEHLVIILLSVMGIKLLS